jgi:hypothetical protein
MLREIDIFFQQQDEPVKSCLLAMRAFIMGYDKNVTEVWRYKMPFYCFNGKRFCYVWLDKKTKQPYIGLVDGNKIIHPKLVAEKRSRMKILYINPVEDLPLADIDSIFKTAISLL